MKRLLAIAAVLALATGSSYAAFATNLSTKVVALDALSDDWTDFRFRWAGYDSQFVKFTIETTSGTGYSMTGYGATFEATKRSSGGTNVVYISKGTTDCTITTSNIVFTCVYSNVPPNGTYNAELMLIDTANDLRRTLARGTIFVRESLYASDGSDFPYPSLTTTFASLADVSISSAAQGDVLYFGGTYWQNLAAGTAGNFLMTGGASANPSWFNISNALVSTYGLITAATNATEAAGAAFDLTLASQLLTLTYPFTVNTATTFSAAANFGASQSGSTLALTYPDAVATSATATASGQTYSLTLANDALTLNYPATHATQEWVTAQLGNYLPLSGGTMAGTLDGAGNVATNWGTAHGTNAVYRYLNGFDLNTMYNSVVNGAGLGEISGPPAYGGRSVTLSIDPTWSNSAFGALLPLAGGTMTGTLDGGGQATTNWGTIHGTNLFADAITEGGTLLSAKYAALAGNQTIAGTNALTDATYLSVLRPNADSTTGVVFQTQNGLTNVLVIDTTNKRVGIGPVAGFVPSYPLHVAGRSFVGSPVAVGTGVYLEPANSATGEAPAGPVISTIGDDLSIFNNGSGTAGSILGMYYYTGSAWKSALEVTNTAGGAWGILALMKSGGNVGIGTNTPQAKLHVAGSAQVDTNLTVSGIISNTVTRVDFNGLAVTNNGAYSQQVIGPWPWDITLVRLDGQCWGSTSTIYIGEVPDGTTMQDALAVTNCTITAETTNCFTTTFTDNSVTAGTKLKIWVDNNASDYLSGSNSVFGALRITSPRL